MRDRTRSCTGRADRRRTPDRRLGPAAPVPASRSRPARATWLRAPPASWRRCAASVSPSPRAWSQAPAGPVASAKAAPRRVQRARAKWPGSISGASSSSAKGLHQRMLTLTGSGGHGTSRMGLADRLADLGQRRRRAARIGPDEFADQNEIRAGERELVRLFARGGLADAGRFEQFGPPPEPLGDRLGRWPPPERVGFA